MTEYTREQISKARQRADAAYDMSKEDAKYHPGEPHPEKAWIDAFTEALGLDVEAEKPEPGLYIMPGNSATRTVDRPALLDSSGSLYWINDEGDLIEGAVHTQEEADRLTPARVVPAEPAVLTEAEVDRLWDEETGLGRASVAVVGVVRRALVKHGGERELPGRMRVEQALVEGLAGTGEDLSYEARQLATNAVMDLLKEANRG